MRYLITLFAAFSISLLGVAVANEKSKSKDAPEHENHEGHEDHQEHGEEGHGHGQEEGEDSHAHGEEESHGHEEGSSQVGPEKGILEASEKDGIKLSPEALMNFELKTKELAGSGPWNIPISARLLAGEEVNLFRLRDGFYRRIDFSIVKRNGNGMTVSSKDLKAGDSIVIEGIGFLRIAEITAFGGAPEGHSH